MRLTKRQREMTNGGKIPTAATAVGVRNDVAIHHMFSSATLLSNSWNVVIVFYCFPPSVNISLRCRLSSTASSQRLLLYDYFVLRDVDAGPTVSNVWPLFGPQAGGTLVTVTGRELTESQQPMIVFVLPDRDHFVILPTNTTQQYRNSDRYTYWVLLSPHFTYFLSSDSHVKSCREPIYACLLCAWSLVSYAIFISRVSRSVGNATESHLHIWTYFPLEKLRLFHAKVADLKLFCNKC